MANKQTTSLLKTRLTLSILASLAVIILVQCNGNQTDTVPYTPVNIQINLANPDFQPLTIDGGFVNVTGGVKGILIYRETGGTYKAFERNCTFEPSSACSRIMMDSSMLFMIDTCCSSQFTLEGNVMSGPAAFSLVQYTTSVEGNYLYINN